jgi:hypothetical protein
MRTPHISSSAHHSSRDRALYGGRLSIIRLVVSVAMVLITLIIFFAQNGRSHSAAAGVSSSKEFSSGMPLP